MIVVVGRVDVGLTSNTTEQRGKEANAWTVRATEEVSTVKSVCRTISSPKHQMSWAGFLAKIVNVTQ